MRIVCWNSETAWMTAFVSGQHRYLIPVTENHGSYGVVYPVLVSPAYRAFSSVPDAYAAAKGINSILMSLAAVPAYFLARRVVQPA